MSTPDPIPDGGSEHLQSEAGEPLVGLDVIPGYTLPTDPPTSPPGIGERVLLLDHAADVAEQVGGTIAAGIATELDAAGATAAQIEAQIRGSIGEHLAAAVPAAVKAESKIRDALESDLNGAYAQASQFGYDYPSLADIAGDAALDAQPQPVPPPVTMSGGSGGGGLPGTSQQNCLSGYPTGLLPVFPEGEPEPNAVSPWHAQTGDPVCFKWQMSLFWFCPSPESSPQAVIIGSPPGVTFFLNPSGRITYGAATEQGAHVIFPANTYVYEPSPACEEEPPPEPPGPPQPPQPPGIVCPPQNADPAVVWQYAIPLSQPPVIPPIGYVADVEVIPPLLWSDGLTCPNQWQVIAAGPPNPINPNLNGLQFVVLFPFWQLAYGPDGHAWMIREGLIPPGWCRIWFDPARSASCPTGPGPQPPGGGVCPAPAQPVCPPAALEIPVLGGGDDLECTQMMEAVERLTAWDQDNRTLVGMDAGADPAAGLTPPSWWGLVTGRSGPALPGVVNRFSDWMKRIVVRSSKSAPCDAGRLTPIALLRGLLSFINQWTGVIPRQVMTPIEQAANMVCQTELPTGPAADGAYLADTITKSTWECWHMAQGDKLRGADAVMQAGRARPNAAMVVLLYRRGAITKADYETLMRREGYISERDRDRMYEVTKSWPALDDVIRMMVRDVSDKGLVERFKMDADFDEKVGTDLMKYADGLGVDKDLLKMYWRAHWHIPSYTQLVEMYHRYRYEDTPEELKVSLDDVRTALKQDDMLPYWVDRMVGIADRPITRIDAQRAYTLHEFDDDQLRRSFQKLGYNDEDSEAMLGIAKAKRDAQEAQQSGLPTARTMINQFAKGVLSEVELRAQLEAIGRKEDRLERAVQSARIARAVRTRDQGTAAVQRAYFSGLIDEGEADTNLGLIGVEPEAKAELLRLWRLQRDARGKMAAAQTLCKWRGKALITTTQQAIALTRLGWSEDDVKRIVYTCESDLAEAMSERAYRDMWRARREAEYQEKLKKKMARIGVPPITLPGAGPVPTPAGEAS